MRRTSFRCTVSAAALLGLAAASLWGQAVISAKAALVTYLEGQAFLDDRPIELSGPRFQDVKENALVRTEDGRAEVLLGPCAVLWIGQNTSFRMLSRVPTDFQIELHRGSAVVELGPVPHDTKLTVQLPPARVSMDRKGVYRFDVAGPQVKVWAGRATVENRDVVIGAGRFLLLDGAALPRKFDVRSTDSLDEWRKDRAASLAEASGLAHQQEQTSEELTAAARSAANNDAPIPRGRGMRGMGGIGGPDGAGRGPVPISYPAGCGVGGR